MKQRHPLAVFGLSVLPVLLFFFAFIASFASRREGSSALMLGFAVLGFIFLFYPLYWFESTANDMRRKGARIPSILLIFIPIINLYWYWKWCTAVEQVTNGRTSTALALVLILLLNHVGMAILQDAFNKVANLPDTTGASASPLINGGPLG